MSELVEVSMLRPHEETDPHNLERTIHALSDPSLLKKHPIHVDRESLVILDGHHRHAACVALGITCIPCIFVDYFSDEILLEPRRDDVAISKEEVTRRGLEGDLYPAKSTKHTFGAVIKSDRCY